MWVCWSRARTLGSSPSAFETFSATGRLPSAGLVGEVDPRERPAAQLGDEPEPADRLAELREVDRLIGAGHGPGRVAEGRPAAGGLAWRGAGDVGLFREEVGLSPPAG